MAHAGRLRYRWDARAGNDNQELDRTPAREGAMQFSRSWLAAGLLALLGFAASDPAGAQSYPSRPVKLIVPYAPGGPNDIVARTLAQKLTEQLGGNFFVENLPGGGGTIGTGNAANAAA